MQTLRAQLTAWYSAALVLTLGAFTLALYLARRSASFHDLDQRVQSEADLTNGILEESYRARGVLVERDSLIGDVRGLLEVVPDYLIITDADGRVLFLSQTLFRSIQSSL